MVTIMSENFAPMRTGTYPRKATMTRILIVEDEESYREPLVYQLTREGYDVSAASTGEEGLAGTYSCRDASQSGRCPGFRHCG